MEIDPQIWHEWSMSPYPAVDACFFFFFSPDILILVFGGYLGLKGSKMSGESKKTFVNGWVGVHRTCVPDFGVLSPKNSVNIWTFVRKTRVIRVVAL